MMTLVRRGVISSLGLFIAMQLMLATPSVAAEGNTPSPASRPPETSEKATVISENVLPSPDAKATGHPARAHRLKGSAPAPANSDDPNDPQKIEDEERDIMEEALALLEESDAHWQKGDLENAQNLLDEAYALIIETDGDTDISRQKDDLRLLIAKRILAVYSAKQTVTAGKRSEIPLRINEDVEKEIRLFQSVERDFFVSSYQRSFKYRPIIVRELKKAGIPEELSWLPLVESGFKVSALSRARALGLWQFIPSTGYKYELNRDEWIDERMDIEKSTRAAISYLKDLHGMFGDWLTVLAAYNCGEGRVLRVISRQHVNYFDRFWDLYHQLPYETARYVPRFLATLAIIKDPQKYGMDLGSPTPREDLGTYELVKTNRSMRLSDIAARIEQPEELLVCLNAELRHRATPPREYALRVPLEMAEKFVNIEGEIPAWEEPKPTVVVKKTVTLRHRVKRGETVASLARKYRISASAIRSFNRLSSKKRLQAGRIVQIPIPSYRYEKIQAASRDKGDEGSAGTGTGKTLTHRIRRGETLSSVSKRYGVSVSDLKRMNRLRSNTVMPGQVLRIAGRTVAEEGGGEPGKRRTVNANAVRENKSSGRNVRQATKTYIVKKGDTLTKIAQKNRTSLKALKEMNGLGERGRIHPGQSIVLE
ncbi:MAG TPA: LysM peptidoglycan-binding domain-containing protein [Syntrophales bacterium]|nr:LysM peptidoglycan-binding domain-containing protein [Syntrophales bacterium]